MAYTTEVYCPMILEAGSPRLRGRQGWSLLRLVSLAGRRLSLSLHGLPYAPVCDHISSSYREVSRTGLRPTLMTSF